MSDKILEQFTSYLVSKEIIADKSGVKPGAGRASAKTIRALWELTDLSANDYADEIAQFYNLPRLSFAQLVAANEMTAAFSPRFLREALIFPYRSPDEHYRLAMADPTDVATLQAVEIVLGGTVAVDVASFEDIATIVTDRIGKEDGPAPADAQISENSAGDDIETLRDLASGAPVVRAVNDMIEKAMELRASDIHIEPFRDALVVRMRVDGLLRAMPTPAGVLTQAVISRIKILAALNIAERRLPQDGAARLRVARAEIDVRVSTMPTQYGESVVIRLLPRDRGILEVSKLGMSPSDETKLKRLLALPHGMIAITGPTGSGKTTTLATMLTALNEPTRKILTIEDPVEYEIQGVNQSQVKPAIGLTFASALRSFVRQDPDVIMVGEVRDAETAHIAVHAALTGHLVLTTLHTETAAAAIPRLLDLKVESFLLKSTLRALIAQRLVRVLCDRCKIEHTLKPADMSEDPRYTALGFRVGETVYQPKGCERCGSTGYRGRIGLFEVLEVDDSVRSMIGDDSDSTTIDGSAIRGGMTTMVADAVAKCRAGITSVAEVLRVITVR